MKGKIGVPVLDELRLCYVAEPLLLEYLSSVEVGSSKKIGEFTLYRLGGDRFKYTFAVCMGVVGSREEVAILKYGRYGAAESGYVYYKICNHILYDDDKLKAVLSFPELLGLDFNNFTAIDIAIDHTKNISSIIKRMMRNDQIKTILNGRQLKDRKRIIPGVSFDYSTSLSKLHSPTITLKQAKASVNKDRGITVQIYDKKAEILNCSGKDYILDYYDNPKRLYRLEVRLNYQELQDYCRRIARSQGLEMIFDPAFLEGDFYYHLSSVLRFTKGRRPIAWTEIISSNGRV